MWLGMTGPQASGGGPSGITCENLLPGGMTGNLSPHTGLGISSFPMGTASADRVLIFALGIMLGGNQTMTNWDLGGNQITRIGEDVEVGGATGLRIVLGRLSIASGTSATLTMNYSGAVGGTAITAWRVGHLVSAVPRDFNVNVVKDTNTLNATLAIPELSLTIGCGFDMNTANNATPLTGGLTIQETLNNSFLGASYGFNLDGLGGSTQFTYNGTDASNGSNTQRGLMVGTWV